MADYSAVPGIAASLPACPPIGHLRDGWDLAFARMAAAGDDTLLDGDDYLPTEWDDEEWTW